LIHILIWLIFLMQSKSMSCFRICNILDVSHLSKVTREISPKNVELKLD
jgi:hypothetical protein